MTSVPALINHGNHEIEPQVRLLQQSQQLLFLVSSRPLTGVLHVTLSLYLQATKGRKGTLTVPALINHGTRQVEVHAAALLPTMCLSDAPPLHLSKHSTALCKDTQNLQPCTTLGAAV